jgi:hypothetical protein
VTAKSFLAAWNEFFFADQSPIPIALFRVIYGVMVIATLLLLRPDWMACRRCKESNLDRG